MNRWRQRLAELSRDDAIIPLSPAPLCDVQTVQNVQNRPPAPAFEHIERIEQSVLSRPCPDGVSPERWQRACEGAKRFANEWAGKAMRLGWTFDELFTLAEPFASCRPSGRGLVRRRRNGHCGQRCGDHPAHGERGGAAHLSKEPAMTDATPRNNGPTTRGRPFAQGNPGRPKGARHRTTLLAEKLMQSDAKAIVEAVLASRRPEWRHGGGANCS